MNFKKWVLLLVLCFTSICRGEESTYISQISNIPEEDIKELKDFFSFLIFEHQFAFTLLGSKPMSTIGYDKSIPSFNKILYPCGIFKLKNWRDIWGKYCHLFPSDRFFLIFQENMQWFEIFLINKKYFLLTVQENIDLFHQILNTDKTVEEILQDVLSCDHMISNALNKSLILYGILLGYGKENAQGFDSLHIKADRFITKLPERTYPDWLTTPFCVLEIPRFASFSPEKTKDIIKKYDEERRKILEVYSKGDFLEITLKRFSSEFLSYDKNCYSDIVQN